MNTIGRSWSLFPRINGIQNLKEGKRFNSTKLDSISNSEGELKLIHTKNEDHHNKEMGKNHNVEHKKKEVIHKSNEKKEERHNTHTCHVYIE